MAAFSLAYAVVYLGFSSRAPDDRVSNALANVLIAGGAIAASIASVAMSERAGGSFARWLAPLGVGYSLLSATHGAYAANLAASGLTAGEFSPTDPRGFATFGLAGLWMLVLGLNARATTALPSRLALLAIVGGLDLVILYAATVAGAASVILVTGGLASVVLGPAFWIWSGRILRG